MWSDCGVVMIAAAMVVGFSVGTLVGVMLGMWAADS